MRVALVSAHSEYPVYRMVGRGADAPLGVLSLGSMIEDRHDVRVFDGQVLNVTPRSMAKRVMEWGPDVVGFSVNFGSVARNTKTMAAHIRASDPAVPIVWGGNHATFNWQALIAEPYIDYVVLHEAENSFPTLLEHIADGPRHELSGVVFKGADGTPEHIPFAGYADLDSLPFCDFDLLDDHTLYGKSMVTTRGCPYTCIYCSTKQMWQRWRYRSAPNVVAEMLDLRRRYGATEITMSDDTFLVRKDRVREICRLLQAEGTPVSWGFSTRLETIDKPMIAMLANAGCNSLFFGVESGSDRVLRQMGRFYTKQEVFDKVSLCASYGITCTTSFMIGIPWETEADVLETFEMMERVETNRVMVSVFTPLPGTPSLEKAADFGIDLVEVPDPEQTAVGYAYAGFNTRHLSSKRIKELWLEGHGIAMRRAREPGPNGRALERQRYGLLAAGADGHEQH